MEQPDKLPPSLDKLVFTIFIVVGLAIVLLLTVLLWTTNATEYVISRDSEAYCTEYARLEAMRFEDKKLATAEAYAACIVILPTRLPMPAEPGTVPATGETWAEACDREYRTWDATTGTVVRRGSPERVECPLVLRDGVWTLPDEKRADGAS